MDHKIACVLFDIGGVLVALDGVPSMAKLASFEFRVGKLGRLNGSRAAAGRAQPHP